MNGGAVVAGSIYVCILGAGRVRRGTALGTGSKRELTLFSCHEAASETEREREKERAREREISSVDLSHFHRDAL